MNSPTRPTVDQGGKLRIVLVSQPIPRKQTEGAAAMGSALRDKTVLIIGRGSGIARAVALLARSEGARSSWLDETEPHSPKLRDIGDPGSCQDDRYHRRRFDRRARRPGRPGRSCGVHRVCSRPRKAGRPATSEPAAVVRHQGHRADHARQTLCVADQPGRLFRVVLGCACLQAQRRLSRRGHHQRRRRLPDPLARG